MRRGRGCVLPVVTAVYGGGAAPAPDSTIGSMTQNVAPLPSPVAGGDDGSAVHLDQLLDDGEAQAEAAAFAGEAGVGLAESLEEMRQELRGDADAGIDDVDLEMMGTRWRGAPAPSRRGR